MIWQPKVGMRVQVRYDKKRASLFHFHGLRGVIEKIANGNGPINCLVRFRWQKEDGTWFDRSEIFPRGNLVQTRANEHGVFLDAERIEIFRKGRYFAEVRIAHEDGWYHWGYGMMHPTGGCGGGPSERMRCFTREEAILSALHVLARSFSSRDRDATTKAMLREIERQCECFKLLQKPVPPPVQLSLFEVRT